MEGDLCKIKRRPIYYRPKMGMVKSRKLEISKIFVFSKNDPNYLGIEAQLISYSGMAWAEVKLSLYAYNEISDYDLYGCP